MKRRFSSEAPVAPQANQSDPGIASRLFYPFLQGTQAPGAILDFLGELLTGEKVMKGTPLAEKFREHIGATPEQLAPRSTLESYAQKFASLAPTAGLGGLTGLGRAAVGAVPATAAKLVGAPEIVQDIAQLGGELAAGRFSGKIPSLKQAKNIQDTIARAAVKTGERGKAPSIRNAINSVREFFTTEVRGPIKEKVERAMGTIEELFTKEGISPTSAMDVKSSLNKLYRELPQSDATKYVQPLINGFDDFFAGYAAQNPSFFNAMTKRNQLTTLEKMAPKLGEFIDKLELNKIPGGKLVQDTVKYILNEGERFTRGLLGNPAGRQYYLDALAGTYKNDPSLVINSIKDIADNVPQVTDFLLGEMSPFKKQETSQVFKRRRRRGSK